MTSTDRNAQPRRGATPRARARVICHMIASVDGRIVTEGWPLSAERKRQYEELHAAYGANAWLCGRVTMQQHFAAGVRSDEQIARTYAGVWREDFIAPGRHDSFAFALDPRGRLLWDSGDLNGDHAVALLSERVSEEYLVELRRRGVSYLLAGTDEIDLRIALEKIAERLGVRTLMLEGGGAINGSFLQAGLIDELSLLLAPVADGRIGTPSLFDVKAKDSGPSRLTLKALEQRPDGMVWLRYAIDTTDR